jgi:tetratricopeptide (TPR) repeat protein
MQGQYEKALTSAERHLELSPSGADAYRSMATALRFLGRFSETIPYIEEAIRLDPYPPAVSFRLFGDCYRIVGRYDEAITMYKNALQKNPDDIFLHMGIAATYVKLGRYEEARVEAKEVLRIHPKFSLSHFVKSLQHLEQSMVDDYIESLRKAGLPE